MAFCFVMIVISIIVNMMIIVVRTVISVGEKVFVPMTIVVLTTTAGTTARVVMTIIATATTPVVKRAIEVAT